MLASTGYRSAGETRNKLIKNLPVDSKLNKSYTQGYLVKKVLDISNVTLSVCMSINLYNTHTCVSTQNVVHIV